MVYDLDVLLRNPTNNYLFGATIIVKTSDREKYVCSGYGMTFGSAGGCSFDNDIARNVVIFGVEIVHDLMQIIAKIVF